MPEIDAQLAASLSGRFRLIRPLGAGGMGAVYLAEQLAVGNRPVALKVLSRKLLDDPDFLLRFQSEAASTGRIHHPNVVTIYESGPADDGTPYICMEFLEGESLRQALTRRGALPVAEVAEILQQAARGLNAAHKLGIIHRDLKPDNIFLTYPDEDAVAPVSPPASNVSQPLNIQVKIVDFGIAKLLESSAHTQTGTLLGTPAYMSFEQASGVRSDELDARSDVYSLGVVVYEMLTSRTPFHSDTPVGYLRKHLMEEPPPFCAVKPDLLALPAVESVVMKALTKDRNRRYRSVLEFARELVQAAEAVDLRNGALFELGAQGGVAGSPSAAISSFVLEGTLAGNTYGVTSVTFSPNGMFLASTGYDYTVKIWDVCSLMLRQTLEEHTKYVYCVAFSRDGRLLASGSVDGTIKLWDVDTGTLRKTLTGNSGAVFSVAFSPDGRLLACGDEDTLKLWDVGSWTLRQTLSGSSNGVYSVSFNPDGRLLASGNGDNTIKIWNVASGTLTNTLLGNKISVICVAFSNDGKLLASRGGDNAINLWDVTLGTLRQTLRGHSNYVWSVAFSPMGKLLASGSQDKTIKLWDVPSGTLVRTLAGHGDVVNSVAFSPNGELLASGGWDDTIKLWRAAGWRRTSAALRFEGLWRQRG